MDSIGVRVSIVVGGSEGRVGIGCVEALQSSCQSVNLHDDGHNLTDWTTSNEITGLIPMKSASSMKDNLRLLKSSNNYTSWRVTSCDGLKHSCIEGDHIGNIFSFSKACGMTCWIYQRTLVLTIAQDQSLSREEIIQFFISRWDHVVDNVVLEDIEPNVMFRNGKVILAD